MVKTVSNKISRRDVGRLLIGTICLVYGTEVYAAQSNYVERILQLSCSRFSERTVSNYKTSFTIPSGEWGSAELQALNSKIGECFQGADASTGADLRALLASADKSQTVQVDNRRGVENRLDSIKKRIAEMPRSAPKDEAEQSARTSQINAIRTELEAMPRRDTMLLSAQLNDVANRNVAPRKEASTLQSVGNLPQNSTPISDPLNPETVEKYIAQCPAAVATREEGKKVIPPTPSGDENQDIINQCRFGEQLVTLLKRLHEDYAQCARNGLPILKGQVALTEILISQTESQTSEMCR